jgi:hypothetical protein
MSSWKAQPVACPRCGAEQTVQIARGLHISRLPAVRRQILDGTFHRFPCPGCGQVIRVDCPLAYTDFRRGHWIHVGLPDELPRWRAIETETLALFDRTVARGPAVLRAAAAGFLVRVVFGYEELREKLLLLDAGLDDGIVECLKLHVLAAHAATLGPRDRLLVDELDEAGGLVMRRPGDPALRFDADAATLAWHLARRAPYQARFPELFEGGFVSASRMILDRPAAPTG